MYKQLWLAMRPHHWIKNLVIFIPLVFGGKLFDGNAFLKTVIAFCLYSIMASGIYLVNDIVDCGEDKKHPTKCFRPLPSGRVSPDVLLITAVVLILTSFFSAFFVYPYLSYVLFAYILLNAIYMIFLHRVVIMDVLCVGGFFYLRILAGSVSSGTQISPLMTSSVVLLALFVSFAKRKYDSVYKDDHWGLWSKFYNSPLVDLMLMLTRITIIFVYSFFALGTQDVVRLSNLGLVATIPFLCLGLFRYTYYIEQIGMADDFVRVFLKDVQLSVIVVLWGIVSLAALYL